MVFALLLMADVMWAIHESSEVGFGVQREKDLGCEWEVVDAVAMRVNSGGFETGHGRRKTRRHEVEVKACSKPDEPRRGGSHVLALIVLANPRARDHCSISLPFLSPDA